MGKGRLEAFSDGVVAIIITIMVLELHPPKEATWGALREIWPTLVSYVLSFVYVGIYWSNHHHLLQAARKVNGATLWANLHLLFWLSLIPFVTNWVDDSHFAALPMAGYGVILLLAAMAYWILVRTLLVQHGHDSTLGRAIGLDWKGTISVGCYAAAIPLAFARPWIAGAVYAGVAAMWLVPDRRIERVIGAEGEKEQALIKPP
jgi:uncharacterized membrane protein